MDSSLRPRVLTPQPPEVHEPKGKWWVMKFISEAVSKVGKGERPALLSFDEMPEWFKRESNQWILHGYRPISGSIYTSLYSLSHIHEESVNIYTHLIPATLFLFQGPKYRLFRTLMFVATGLSGVVPLIHALKVFGISQMMKKAFQYTLAKAGCLLSGTIFYAVSLPSPDFARGREIDPDGYYSEDQISRKPIS
ncbi:hypothetical protein TESG_01334 [Trichophyton tonsurans CBS 112818]|uniref:Uncharacterized protein n=1 Tax=Trichophyton tonsurans (strain CBS 112818) TaxID=647933 RepID=F2RR52_TRIT1|nr:hypothetical protein TESG_01334 [Trichophyton tonsurans CBS 112818]